MPFRGLVSRAPTRDPVRRPPRTVSPSNGRPGSAGRGQARVPDLESTTPPRLEGERAAGRCSIGFGAEPSDTALRQPRGSRGYRLSPRPFAMPSVFLRRKPLRCVFPSSANDEIESCALVSERCTRFGTRRHRLLDTAWCSGRGGATVSPPTPSVPSPCPRSDGVMDGEARWRRTRPRSRGSESRAETE